MTNSLISDNSAQSGGAGIRNGGAMALSNNTISGNSALAGGGIANSGTMTLINNTISNNHGSGAGVYNLGGNMTLTDNTISDNATRSGGSDGGFVNYLGVATLSNNTIVGNSAHNAGAISNDGSLTLVNDTIVENSAFGGGIGGIDTSSVITIQNTILAGNFSTTSSDFSGSYTGNNDLIGNQVNVSTALAPSLANNGGPTQTLALLPGSPAIGAGGALTNVEYAIQPTDTTIYVGNAATIAATPGTYYILIDQEEMLVTNVNLTNNTMTVQRGYDDTTATTHAIGAGVYFATDQRGVARPTPSDIGAYQTAAYLEASARATSRTST